ncbi:MAG: hypothetical protein ACOH1T_07940 [Microbacteriaceae bacterium]
MNTTILDPVRAKSIEQELTAIGTSGSRLQHHQRRARRILTVSGSAALVTALTAGAIVASNLPGDTTVTAVGEIVTGSFTGTANIELGEPPANAAVVVLDLTCTTGGKMEVLTAGPYNSGVSWDCGNPVFDGSTHIADGRLPASGATFITITAEPGTEWTVTARYASSVTTKWGVNANGQTYGVPNDNGSPDLSAALATNGKQGYILDDDLWAGNGYINVYESDGTTVIGKFPNGVDE